MSTNGRVQIADYSDREILLMMLDLGGEVTTPDLAARIYGWSGPDYEDETDRTHGHRCTSQRLSWMSRFGLVEGWVTVDPPKIRTWKVSHDAERMMSAQLSRVVETAFTRDLDAASLQLANRVGEKLVKAGEITGTAMRRELQFQITRRKRRG